MDAGSLPRPEVLGSSKPKPSLASRLASSGFVLRPLSDPLLGSEDAGECVLSPEFGCHHGDTALLEGLAADMESCGALVRDLSGRHSQVYGDALRGSAIFSSIVDSMLSAFDLALVDCFVNLYRDGGDMTYWHQDCYDHRQPRPSFTLGLSLGAARDLAFHHVATGKEFKVPQANGDVFAFDERFNVSFKHSVPPVRPKSASGRRLSVIIWAREASDGAPSTVCRSWPSHLRSRPDVPSSVDWSGWAALGGGRAPAPAGERLQPRAVARASSTRQTQCRFLLPGFGARWSRSRALGLLGSLAAAGATRGFAGLTPRWPRAAALERCSLWLSAPLTMFQNMKIY
ncbi:unnamed protein product [Polarella glacialis]|uniref:Fe2OG dioxygenase domain-containing protein n=1 Tax=Polarella glacialis TaxID=89957 RepID=A0A813KYZ9_POLGL|nr:unnamed protein product [Polarella glacialis]